MEAANKELVDVLQLIATKKMVLNSMDTRLGVFNLDCEIVLEKGETVTLEIFSDMTMKIWKLMASGDIGVVQ